MRVVEAGRDGLEPIQHFASHGASSLPLGHGTGETHVYAIEIGPGGEIGPHEAGFDQLFLVVEGSGWAAGADGVRHAIDVGRAARFERGEVHAKGSETGMKAIMVQVTRLENGD